MGFTFTRNLTTAGGLVCVQRFRGWIHWSPQKGSTPVSTLLAKTLAPSTGAARYSQLGTIRPRVGIAPFVVAEPGKISLPILDAAFSYDSPQMEFAALFACLASSHGIESACFWFMRWQKIALERGTANMPRFFPGQLSSTRPDPSPDCSDSGKK